MDAWETLISNSTLQSGDVWEHLNSQTGGESTIVDSYEISVEQTSINMVLSGISIALYTQNIAVTVELPEIYTTLSSLEVEIDE